MILLLQVPAWGPLESYTAAVEALPLTNSPAVFGLHPNAEIGYYSAATRDMWRDLLSLQPRKPGRSDGPSREDTIAQIARDISAKVMLL
jgi:dynein heavy chain, axonemal